MPDLRVSHPVKLRKINSQQPLKSAHLKFHRLFIWVLRSRFDRRFPWPLKASKKDHGALFVGQWAPPFLLLGIYNKLVKQLGSDAAVSN